METLKELETLIEGEIKKINMKGELSPSELDRVYQAIDVIKDIHEIMNMSKMEKVS